MSLLLLTAWQNGNDLTYLNSIRRALNSKNRTGSDDHSDPDDLELIKSRRSYELCASAANHITSIGEVFFRPIRGLLTKPETVTAYRERYPLNRCSVFLCYYVFTASIMHVISCTRPCSQSHNDTCSLSVSVTAYPDDPQAHINLRRCLDALSAMRYVWPSAGRALELLSGAKMNLSIGPGASTSAVTASSLTLQRTDVTSGSSTHKRKSSHEDGADDNVAPTSVANGILNNGGEYVAPIRSAVTVQTHHTVRRQPSQRELAPSDQYRPVRQQPYHSSAESYAIQPPSLLPTAEYRWSDNPSTAHVSSGSQVVVSEESNVRGAGRQHHQDEEPLLTTSVLPQLYSTGLVDEHHHHHQHLLPTSSHHGQAQQVQQPHSNSQHHQRYPRSPEMATHVQTHSQPQFWGDYSTFSQLGSTAAGGYNGLGMSVGGMNGMDLPIQDHQHPQHQNHILPHTQHASVANVPGMYIPEPYDLYGK